VGSPLPEERTCTFGPGDVVTIEPSGYVLPDGSVTQTVAGCTFEPGAIIRFYYTVLTPPTHSKRPRQVEVRDVPVVPREVTPTAVVFQKVPVKPLSPEDGGDAAAVVAAVVVAAAAAGVGVRAFRRAPTPGSAGPSAQSQQQEEQERKECGTKSDTVLDETRAAVDSVAHIRDANIADPAEVVTRADALLARMDIFDRVLTTKKGRAISSEK